MKKSKDAIFYYELREIFLKLAEYSWLLVEQSENLDDEFACLREELRLIEYRLLKYLNLRNFSTALARLERNLNNDKSN